MKTNIFITSYKSRIKHKTNITQEEILDEISSLIKPIHYLPYDDKLNLVQSIIIDSEKTNYPSANRYRLFVIKMISTYTNLEMNIDDFDLLQENNLIDYIISLFKREYDTCSTLLKMCYDDYLKRG